MSQIYFNKSTACPLFPFQLTLRHKMDSAKQATKSGNLNELSMVLLNNVLSLPLGIILVLAFNEVEYLLAT
jgi:GDP-mannose transporter